MAVEKSPPYKAGSEQSKRASFRAGQGSIEDTSGGTRGHGKALH